MSQPTDPAQVMYNEAYRLQDPMLAAMARGDSVIQEWYEGRTAFITGGSGYLGKLLIEKLIRSCKLRKIYILIREKKGKSINKRLDELIQDPDPNTKKKTLQPHLIGFGDRQIPSSTSQLFTSLREQRPDFANILQGVKGDVAELNLGISNSDRETLIQEVDIIFHLAATTRFDETLKKATLINVRGTRELLAFAKDCQKLKSLVHVSTAFTHATHDMVDKEILEQFYPSPISPDALIEMVETTDEKRLDAITKDLILGWPNTYTFTKAVSEELVRTKTGELPMCIFRPSIVLCPYYEPDPGYLDASCAYSTTRIILGAGMGVMRVLFTSTKVRLSCIPADFSTNATIVCGWKTGISQSSLDPTAAVKVYTLSSSKCNVGFFVISNTLLRKGREIPTPKSIWFYFLVETDNTYYYKTCFWLLHYIPAYIMDTVCTIFKIKLPEGLKSFVKLYTKIEKMCTVYSYYLTREWFIRDDNMAALYDSLTPTDKDLFCFDVLKVDWERLILIWGLGVRKYIVKDGLKDTVYARKKQQIFKVLNYAILVGFLYSVWLLINIV